MKQILRNTIIAGFCALTILFTQTAEARYAAYIIDVESGQVLRAVNENTRNYPASLTKIMTLYMVFDALNKKKIGLNDPIVISARAAGQAPSKIGLKVGQTIRVEDAILALVTKSANDIATAVAEHLAGSEIQFAKLMTQKARSLGMNHTSFKNANGLPNRGQLSTAKDMATLGIRIQKDFPQYYPYFSRREFKYQGTVYRNHNRLLAQYEGMDGIKTGFTTLSGFNLVASVRRDGHHLIGVVLGGQTSALRDKDMKTLLDKGFASLDKNTNTRVARVEPSIKPPPIPPVKVAQVKNNFADPSKLAKTDKPILSLQLAEGDIDSTNGDSFAEQVANNRNYKTPNLNNSLESWVIQVGAFSSEKAAYNAAETAKSLLSGKFQSFIGNSAIHKPKNSKFYKALLVGFSENNARKTCNQLKQKRIDCFAVKLASATNG